MSDFPPLHDYSRSRAVVMGTWDYTDPGLCALPAARHSLKRMFALLTGELCGWPEDKVTVLENRTVPGNIPDELVTAFTDVEDVALFYFVGHGQVDPEDQLCLGLTGSRTEATRRATTSLQFDAVRKALVGSGAATRIVILDCCFAGLATRRDNTLASVTLDVMDKAGGAGAYTMAATGQYTTALFETDTPNPQTYFTKYLADAIEAGIPSEPAGLRLHSLYTHLQDALARDKRPTPQRRAIDNARDFVFAHNANPMPAPTPAEDADAEQDYLRRRIDQLAETIKLIADAVTARPPVEPVAPAAPVELVRRVQPDEPAEPEPEPEPEPDAVSRAEQAEESAKMRARIAQLEAAVLALNQAVPSEAEKAAAAAKAAPRKAAASKTAPPRTAAPKTAPPKAAPSQSAAGGTPPPRPKPKRKPQAKTAGPAQAPTQTSTPKPTPTPTPTPTAVPGPRVTPSTVFGSDALSDFLSDFSDEIASEATGDRSEPEDKPPTISDRTRHSDLDKFFDGVAEEISLRRLGTTPDD